MAFAYSWLNMYTSFCSGSSLKLFLCLILTSWRCVESEVMFQVFSSFASMELFSLYSCINHGGDNNTHSITRLDGPRSWSSCGNEERNPICLSMWTLLVWHKASDLTDQTVMAYAKKITSRHKIYHISSNLLTKFNFHMY